VGTTPATFGDTRYMNSTIFICLEFFIFSDGMHDITIQDNLGIRKKKLTGMWIIMLKVLFHYMHSLYGRECYGTA
jgi:hypothetical protein